MEEEILDSAAAEERPSPGRTAQRAANIVSRVFHPFLMPAAAVALLLYGGTVVSGIFGGMKLYIMGSVVFSTVIFPASFVLLLHKLKAIPSLSADTRGERKILLLVAAIGYVLCIYMLPEHIITQLIYRIMWGALLSATVCFLVNIFWKTSLHMAAAGGVVAILISVNLYNYGYVPGAMVISILAAGLLGTSRLYLGKHSGAQIAAGFVTGFAALWLMLGH